MMKPSVSGKRRYVKLRKILRNKMLTQALKYAGGALEGFGGREEEKRAGTEAYSPPDADAACKIVLPGGTDIGTEIDMRVDWLMARYADELRAALEDLQSIRNYNSKLNYIKHNFLDRVCPDGKLAKDEFYDAAAPMSCLAGLNERTGDLDGFVSGGAGRSMAVAPAFEKYVRSKYRKCVRVRKNDGGARPLSLSALKTGMILLQRSAGSGQNTLHLVVYAGDGKVLSFNRDGIYNVKSDLDTVIVDLPEIARQEWKERLGEYRLDDEEELLALRTDLYIGRESDFRKGLAKLKSRKKKQAFS